MSSVSTPTLCHFKDLGLIDYEKAYHLQKLNVERVLEGRGDILLICEHPTVLTLGRLASRQHILCTPEKLKVNNIPVIPIDRGGEVTLHCPGQLVLYPILNLNNHGKDLKIYFRKLEQVIIDFLREFDIFACRILNQTGVWVQTKKIASIGVGVKKWITFHGLSVNVNPDLRLYSCIRPCGLDIEMTSMMDHKGITVKMDHAKKILLEIFRKNFYNH